MLERSAHRVRVGVVGVVQDEAASGQRDLLAAPGREPDAGHALVRAIEREAERLVGVKRGERVHGEVALCERQLELDHRVPESESGRTVPPRRRPIECGGSRCRRGRGTAPAPLRPQARRQFRLSAAHAIASAFASATRSTVPRSSRCSGPMCGITTIEGCAIAQSAAIWPEPAHPHLGDQDLRLGLEPAHGERQSDLVVQAPLRPDRRRVRRTQRTEDVLRRRLARRADDGDDLRVALRDGRATRAPRARAPGRRGRASPPLARAPRRRSGRRCSARRTGPRTRRRASRP